jgi:hypothetical protein
MPRFGPKPLVASGMLAAAGAMVWLARLGPHTGYAAGVLGPVILASAGVGMVIAPVINTGIFAVGAVTAGVLLRSGPLRPASTPPPEPAEVTTAEAKAGPLFPGSRTRVPGRQPPTAYPDDNQ